MSAFNGNNFSHPHTSPDSGSDNNAGSDRKEEVNANTASTHETSAEHQRAWEVRRAIASAQASLFGASTAEGSRAIREISIGIHLDTDSLSASENRDSSASDSVAFMMSSTPEAAVSNENNHHLSRGLPTTVAVDATTRLAEGGGGTYDPSTGPLPSPMSPTSTRRGHGGFSDLPAPPARGVEVLCEVSNLYYGIDVVPQGDGAKEAAATRCYRGPRGWWKGTARTETCDDVSARRSLLQGVSCRVCAGEMVAVVVSDSR